MSKLFQPFSQDPAVTKRHGGKQFIPLFFVSRTVVFHLFVHFLGLCVGLGMGKHFLLLRLHQCAPALHCFLFFCFSVFLFFCFFFFFFFCDLFAHAGLVICHRILEVRCRSLVSCVATVSIVFSLLSSILRAASSWQHCSSLRRTWAWFHVHCHSASVS